MKKSLVLWVGCLFLSNAFADPQSTEQGASEYRDILQVIEENLEAAQKEDFDAWVRTYHEGSRSCKDRGAEMLDCFRVYDMKYTLEKTEVLEKSDEEAKVLFIQVNRTVRGPDNNDRKITGIHVMRKSYGKWKIYDTEIRKIHEIR